VAALVPAGALVKVPAEGRAGPAAVPLMVAAVRVTEVLEAESA
jgi:hypothetical protein